MNVFQTSLQPTFGFVKTGPVKAKVLFSIYLFCAIHAMAAVEAIHSSSEKSWKLSIDFPGMDQGNGTLMIAVFNKSNGFPEGEPFKTMAISGENKTNKVAQMMLPQGTYAVAVFLDVNNNGKLDRNMFYFPSEPYGFSNNAKGSFGPPDFDSAAILLDRDRHIQISLSK